MLNDILGQINDLMYTYLLLFLLLGTGLYFSIRSRFAQVRLMKEGFRRWKMGRNRSHLFRRL